MAKKTVDLEKVQEAYERARYRSQVERHAYERNWFRNVLFYLGVQWIQYLPNSRLWVPRNLKKWVPRPVTNKFASHCNTIIQVLCSKSPEVSARPATDTPEDIATADVTNRVLEVIFKEANTKDARRTAAAWMTMTGNAWLHPNYDNDPIHGSTFFQHDRCKDCGETFAPDQAGPGIVVPNPLPEAGENPDLAGIQNLRPQMEQKPEKSENSCPFCMSTNMEKAVDEGGEPVGEDLPNGRLAMTVFSPFEVYADLEARGAVDLQELLVHRRYPLEVIKRRYEKPDLEADNGTANQSASVGLNLLRAIAYAAGNTQYGTGFASGRSIGDDLNITTDFLWKRPCKDFPDGLVAVYANDQLLNESELQGGIPYRRKRDGKPIWPWHLCPFDRVPGRLMGKTPLDDAAPKQEQRNKLESLIELIIRRSANPVWLVAKGTGITEITGEPGQILEGNWAMDPRLKPSREPGENVPTSVIAWLEKIDRDMEEIVGVFEVMKGQAPPGVTAGTALRLLLERAVTRFTPVIETYEEVFAEATEDALCIFQQNATDDRINMIQGPGDTWEVERFSKADLTGDVNIIVEAGSSVPKSAVGQQAMIGDLVTLGVINPQDPEVQYKILEEFGATKLLGEVDQNIKQAQRENWKFMNEDKTPIYNPLVDNHQVHKQIHKSLMLSSQFEDLPENKKAIMNQHLIDHVMLLMGGVPPPVDTSAGPGMPGNRNPDGTAKESPTGAAPPGSGPAGPNAPARVPPGPVGPPPGPGDNGGSSMDQRMPPMPGGPI
jgi:hypothetical protein